MIQDSQPDEANDTLDEVFSGDDSKPATTTTTTDARVKKEPNYKLSDKERIAANKMRDLKLYLESLISKNVTVPPEQFDDRLRDLYEAMKAAVFGKYRVHTSKKAGAYLLKFPAKLGNKTQFIQNAPDMILEKMITSGHITEAEVLAVQEAPFNSLSPSDKDEKDFHLDRVALRFLEMNNVTKEFWTSAIEMVNDKLPASCKDWSSDDQEKANANIASAAFNIWHNAFGVVTPNRIQVAIVEDEISDEERMIRIRNALNKAFEDLLPQCEEVKEIRAHSDRIRQKLEQKDAEKAAAEKAKEEAAAKTTEANKAKAKTKTKPKEKAKVEAEKVDPMFEDSFEDEYDPTGSGSQMDYESPSQYVAKKKPKSSEAQIQTITVACDKEPTFEQKIQYLKELGDDLKLTQEDPEAQRVLLEEMATKVIKATEWATKVLHKPKKPEEPKPAQQPAEEKADRTNTPPAGAPAADRKSFIDKIVRIHSSQDKVQLIEYLDSDEGKSLFKLLSTFDTPSKAAIGNWQTWWKKFTKNEIPRIRHLADWFNSIYADIWSNKLMINITGTTVEEYLLKFNLMRNILAELKLDGKTGWQGWVTDFRVICDKLPQVNTCQELRHQIEKVLPAPLQDFEKSIWELGYTKATFDGFDKTQLARCLSDSDVVLRHAPKGVDEKVFFENFDQSKNTRLNDSLATIAKDFENKVKISFLDTDTLLNLQAKHPESPLKDVFEVPMAKGVENTPAPVRQPLAPIQPQHQATPVPQRQQKANRRRDREPDSSRERPSSSKAGASRHSTPSRNKHRRRQRSEFTPDINPNSEFAILQGKFYAGKKFG